MNKTQALQFIQYMVEQPEELWMSSEPVRNTDGPTCSVMWVARCVSQKNPIDEWIDNTSSRIIDDFGVLPDDLDTLYAINDAAKSKSAAVAGITQYILLHCLKAEENES